LAYLGFVAIVGGSYFRSLNPPTSTTPTPSPTP
jgi:hypothetical protein